MLVACSCGHGSYRQDIGTCRASCHILHTWLKFKVKAARGEKSCTVETNPKRGEKSCTVEKTPVRTDPKRRH